LKVFNNIFIIELKEENLNLNIGEIMDNKFIANIIQVLDRFYEFEERENIIYQELIKPSIRFEDLGVEDTIVFFGSAVKINQEEIISISQKTETSKKEQNLLIMDRYYKDAEILSEKLTVWVKSKFKNKNHCVVCSGGGAGIMESANKGAKLAGGNSMGLNIKIPTEQKSNVYQSKDLKFIFHYFFMRKYWFSYLAKAIIVFPGGFGTLDELFETYTLIKTKRNRQDIPVVLYGKEYWKDIINFEKMVEWGTISGKLKDMIKIFDDVDEVFEYLKVNIEFTPEV